MSGTNSHAHPHVPEMNRCGDGEVKVVYGDTHKYVWRHGPLLAWRLRRAVQVTRRRHDRGTAHNARVNRKVQAALVVAKSRIEPAE